MTAAGDVARRRAEMPDAAREILDARTLTSAHRRLAEVLAPGMRVLDVGCGTGAITRGIAGAVAPRGCAVGIDQHPRFMAAARRAHADVPNLHFAVGDAYALPVRPVFDIVSAARVLNWLSAPLDALRAMVGAARPGGRVVVLDYNHRKIVWTPHPPASMRAFYAAIPTSTGAPPCGRRSPRPAAIRWCPTARSRRPSGPRRKPSTASGFEITPGRRRSTCSRSRASGRLNHHGLGGSGGR